MSEKSSIIAMEKRLADAKAQYEEALRAMELSQFTLPDHPSSDGRWYVKVKDITTKSGRRSIAARSREELEEKLLAFSRGTVPEKSEVLTFRAVFERVQADYVLGIKDPVKLKKKQSTVMRHWQTYRRYFDGRAFERLPLVEIRPQDITAVCQAVLMAENIRAKEFANAKAILKAVYAYAESHDLIPPDKKNAFERADFSTCMNMLVDTPDVETRGFSDIELMKLRTAITNAIDENPNYFPAYALLLQMLLGLRRGEVPALKWSDIQNGILTVKRTECAERIVGETERFYIAEYTKTHYNREIPITRRGQELLNQIKALQQKLGLQTEFLFPADNDLGIVSLNSVYNFFVRMCKRAGVKIDPDLVRGPHAFRRTVSTELRKVGTPEDASRILGHSVGVDDNNYYLGPDAARMRELLEAAGF